MNFKFSGRGRAGAVGSVVVVILATIALAGCNSSAQGNSSSDGGSKGSGPVQVHMALAPSLASLPEYVALKQGMFKAQNLDVTIQSSADITNLPAALGKQFDFGVGLQNVLISASASGLPLVACGGGQVEASKAPNSGLIVKGNSGIKDPKDLVGKKVGVATVNGSMGLEFLWWLHQNGVDQNKVQLVQVAFANMADQLASGSVDAVFPLVPFVTGVLAKVPGSVKLGDPGLSVGNGTPTQGSFLMCDKTWAKQHSDVVCNAEKAMADAIDFIDKSPDQAKQILSGYSNIPMAALANIDLGQFRAYETPEDLAMWLNVMKTVGNFQGSVDTDTLAVKSCTSGG
jgi:NitT/TauT family transport system substrate-binding protein